MVNDLIGRRAGLVNQASIGNLPAGKIVTVHDRWLADARSGTGQTGLTTVPASD